MTRLFVLIAALLTPFFSAHAAAPVPYGLFVGGPDGTNAAGMSRFQSEWDASVTQLGRQPEFFGAFSDFRLDWDKWPANARWAARSWAQSGRARGLKPVIGLKLSTNAYWNRQSDAFREVIAGKHDKVYQDIVTAWGNAGFTELRFRISYEFDGSFMPDNFGQDAVTLDLWRRAFSHVADVMHAIPGVKVLIVWNPADINWAAHSMPDAYPGDGYVDVIASDIYSSLYPLSFHDWSGGPDEPDFKTWAKIDVNRIHFWDYPGATKDSAVGRGWGLVQALDFAQARGKPFAICETGVGGDNIKNGLSDDPVFPTYLTERLAEFRTRGGKIDHVIIWDYNAGDGPWRFTGIPAKAATASSWTEFVKGTRVPTALPAR